MRIQAALSVIALGCLLAGAGGVRAEWFADAGAAFVHDDNVSRAQRATDIRSDHALVAHASAGHYVQLTDRTGATLAASMRREQFAHYAGLSHFAVGPSASIRTKLGLGADAPWVRLGASALRLEYDNDVRTGWLFALAAAAGVRVHERVDLRAELRLERRLADRKEQLVTGVSGAAFDLDGAAVVLGADFTLTRDTLVSAAYTYRKGDVVSSTRRNRDVFVASDAIARDPAFGPDIIAYRLDARSHVFELGVSQALGSRLSANFGVARSLTYGRGGNDYYGTAVSASLIYAF